MKLNTRKIFIKTNGCIRRSFDGSRLKKYFELNGCEIINKPKKADYIIFISCSVKKNREEESLKKINKLSRYKAEVIVGGCLPDIAPNKFRQEFKGKFFSSKNINKIDDIFNDFKVKFPDVPDDPVFEISSPIRDPFKVRLINKMSSFREFYKNPLHYSEQFFNKESQNKQQEHNTHAYMRIGYGCLGNCSYCSVKKALEPFKSKPLDECLREYKELLDKGYRSFTIMSPDTGSYGLDIGSSLPELLDSFSDVDGSLNIKWNVIDLNPRWILKYQIQFLKKIISGKITGLLVPIQSASNRILKLMNRYDRIEHVGNALMEFRSQNPNLYLRTHAIIGFPTETERDFLKTIDFIKKIKFNHVDLLLYYEAEGTVSSKLANKVEKEIAKSRIKRAYKILKNEGMGLDCDDI